MKPPFGLFSPLHQLCVTWKDPCMVWNRLPEYGLTSSNLPWFASLLCKANILLFLYKSSTSFFLLFIYMDDIVIVRTDSLLIKNLRQHL
jgi:hypothetical protein